MTIRIYEPPLEANYLTDLGCEIGMFLKIVRRQDLPYGWLFFLQLTRLSAKRRNQFDVGRKFPIIVDAVDGSLHVLGTAVPVDAYLREYESTRGHVKR